LFGGGVDFRKIGELKCLEIMDRSRSNELLTITPIAGKAPGETVKSSECEIFEAWPRQRVACNLALSLDAIVVTKRVIVNRTPSETGASQTTSAGDR